MMIGGVFTIQETKTGKRQLTQEQASGQDHDNSQNHSDPFVSVMRHLCRPNNRCVRRWQRVKRKMAAPSPFATVVF